MPRHAAIAIVLLACTGAVSVAGTPAQGKGTGSYKWVDENGVVHYGDRVPPAASKRERKLLNDQGVEVASLGAEKTPEQVEAERRAQEQATRARERDQFLRTTYTSVQDIEMLRDQRLGQLRELRTATSAYVTLLNERLSGLQARARTFKPYNTRPDAPRMPDELAQDLVRTVNELNRQRQLLDERLAAESQVRQQFQLDIDRYRELHASN